MPAALRNLTGGHADDLPSIGSDLDSTPELVSKIQIDATIVLRDAEVNGALGCVKLRACLKQIECRTDRSSACGGTCGFVVFSPQPGTQADAANGPGFPMSIDDEIGKRGAIGGVKQLRAGRQIGQHISRLCPARGHPCRLELSAASVRCGFGSRRRPRSHSGASFSTAYEQLDRVDADLFPPSPLIADTMNRPVMDSAQRRYELVTHLPAERTRLHEAQMMGI